MNREPPRGNVDRLYRDDSREDFVEICRTVINAIREPALQAAVFAAFVAVWAAILVLALR